MIILDGNPILREVASPVTNFDSDELNELIILMFQIMRDKKGVGLAAPQIGVSQRIFVYGFEFSERYPGLLPIPNTIIINPEILTMSETTNDFEEGCLSIPNKRGVITRYNTVTFICKDIAGNSYEKTIYDFEARIFQHEMDHINGILIADLATKMSTK